MGLICSRYEIELELEEKAELMTAFRQNIQSHSKKSLNWSNELPLSKWQYVRTVPKRQIIARLDFTDLRLTGSIPEFHFHHLKDLNLSENEFKGQVSWNSLFNLKSLEVLNLSQNKLCGEIPWRKMFSCLRNLTSLILSGNNFSGDLTDEFWIGLPYSISYFDIHDNLFSGVIGEASVKILNHMKLSLHPYINLTSLKGFAILSSLQDKKGQEKGNTINPMFVNNSSISGIATFDRTPLLKQEEQQEEEGIGRREVIEQLQLAKCSMHGSIPLLSFFKDLKYLDISWNNFSGSIPNNFFLNMPLLEYIDISHNDLSGGFFPLLARALSKEKQKNVVDSSLSSSSSYHDNMASNRDVLSGGGGNNTNITTSASLGDHLQVIRCNSNRLTGTLATSTFSKMYRLTELDLSLNKFTISSRITLNHLPKIDMSRVFLIGNEFENIDPQSASTHQLVKSKIESDKLWQRVSAFAYFLHFNRLHLKRLAYLESLRSCKMGEICTPGGGGDEDEDSIRASLMTSTVLSSVKNTKFNPDSLRIFSNIFENVDICRIIGSFL